MSDGTVTVTDDHGNTITLDSLDSAYSVGENLMATVDAVDPQ
jgi:hypothetical protein